MNTQRLTFIITVLGTLHSALALGPIAALLTAVFLLGLILGHLTRREQ